MNRERAGDSLQATALVNEAYLRLIDYKRMEWQDRAHFFAVSAQLMRRILVERARRRNLKRGGGIQHINLNEAIMPNSIPDITALDDALNQLALVDRRKVQIVEMRYFGGLSVDEVAEVMKTSARTVARDWNAAKAWLYRELRGTADGPSPLETNR
jgi:RNA polymerase sigma-70 factor, ECF subfamily